MTQRQQIAESVARLAAAFPRIQMGKATVDAYLWGLSDLPAADVDRAVRLAIRTHTFPPTVAELRTIIAEQRLQLPVPGVALETVERFVRADDQRAYVICPEGCDDGWSDKDNDVMCLRCHGDGRVLVPNPIRLAPEIRRAFDAVGGKRAWQTTDSPSVLRAQFMRLYEQFREEAKQAVLQGDLALPAAPTPLELTG